MTANGPWSMLNPPRTKQLLILFGSVSTFQFLSATKLCRNSETFWNFLSSKQKTLCSCAVGQVANAALDKYEKKKQELEKLEALLERLALRKNLTMQRDHSWCQALLDFLASYATSYHLLIYDQSYFWGSSLSSIYNFSLCTCGRVECGPRLTVISAINIHKP